MTRIRTARATYEVTGLEVRDGTIVMIGRGANGRVRMLKRSDITNARWYAAISQYLSEARKASRA